MKKSPARRKKSNKSKSGINRSVRKKLYRVAIVSFVFLISLGFLFSYSFYKYLNQNFASALSSTSYSIIDDKIPTLSYIVIDDFNSDPVKLVKVNFIIFDKESKKVSIYDLPLDNNYAIPGRFGSEELSKTFALGGLNSDDRFLSGSDSINRSIFKLFGFKVDKFILTDSYHDEFFNKLWHEGGVLNLVNLKSITDLKDSLRTDMDIREFYDLLSFIYSLPGDRVVDDKNTPLCFCDTIGFDNFIREYTYESAISKENKNISVLNGTNYSGLASFGSRVVTNFGGRVVSTKNTLKYYDTSVIIADDINSETVNFLSRVFKISTIITKEESRSFLENEIDRSDVVVIFGFDTSGDLY